MQTRTRKFRALILLLTAIAVEALFQKNRILTEDGIEFSLINILKSDELAYNFIQHSGKQGKLEIISTIFLFFTFFNVILNG